MTRKGFTIIEAMLASGLAAFVALAIAVWLRSGGMALSKRAASQQLELEASDAGDLISGHLRRADPASLAILSEGRPWSRLSFGTGSHRYEFFLQGSQLYFVADKMAPRLLSQRVASLWFAVDQARMPPTITWSLLLRPTPEAPMAASVYREGTVYLPRRSG